jgi:hypothetical protein
MAFNVNKIVQSINKDGVLKPSKFEVVFNRIGKLAVDLSDLGTIRCIAAMIPGITINTTDFRLHGGMPVLRVPVSRTYNDLRLTFLTTKDSKDRYQFERWMKSIQDFSTNTMAYYDDISSDITIKVYDEGNSPLTRPTGADEVLYFNEDGPRQILPGVANQNLTYETDASAYQVTVMRAIPLSIDDVDLSWADTDKLMEYSVTFSYEQLKINNDSNPTMF